MLNVVKISAKINTMQNINNLRFGPSLSLTSLKLCTVGLSTIKHQRSKKLTRWIEATWTKITWETSNCLQEFVHKRGSKFSLFARTHAWRHFLHWWTAVSIMTCRKSDYTTSIPSVYVKDSERTKSKMLVFCMVLIFTLIFMTFDRHLLDRW